MSEFDYVVEIDEAVAFERAEYERKKAEKEAGKKGTKPPRDKAYFDQLRRDFRDNHLGDARRMAAKFGGRLIYDNIQGRWSVHNCTHWEEDVGRIHLHWAPEIAADYRDQAAFIGRKINEIMAKPEYQDAAKSVKKEILRPWQQTQRAWEKRAQDLHDPARIKKILELVGVESTGFLGIKGREWNPNPHLFACANKVLDLRTGKALDPDPLFYINRASEVEWRGLHAESESWEIFIDQIFAGDEEVKAYVQKLVGYWLTGLMTHQEFYCLWGPQGRNGKGVFFRTIRKIMGSYYQTIPSKFLLDEKTLQTTDRPDQILVVMEHSRLVCASEAPKRSKFSEGAIKQLSGADPITCRGMWAEHMTEYEPKFKMLFATNRIPKVDGDDKAFQERLRIIKFPCTFKHVKEPDPDAKIYPVDTQLEFKLHTSESLSGILAWAVRGAIEFLRTQDLTPPASVLEDVAGYMKQNDFIGEFIKDCLEITTATKEKAGHNEKTQMKDIYKTFCVWCKEEQSVPESKIPSLRTLGTDFSNRVEIFRVPPTNKTFYNVRIQESWIPEDEKQGLQW